jgi:hypothetical protein
VNGRRNARSSQPADQPRVLTTPRVRTPRIATIRPINRADYLQPFTTAALRSLVVLIPLYYNSDLAGRREPVEHHKLYETEREIQERFSGYSKSHTEGWYRSDQTGKGFLDDLIRYQIDAVYDAATMSFLKDWKAILEQRFEQEAIYMTLSGPLVSL